MKNLDYAMLFISGSLAESVIWNLAAGRIGSAVFDFFLSAILFFLFWRVKHEVNKRTFKPGDIVYYKHRPEYPFSVSAVSGATIEIIGNFSGDPEHDWQGKLWVSQKLITKWKYRPKTNK